MCAVICWLFVFGGAFSIDYPNLNDASRLIYRACDSLNGMPVTEVVIAGEVTGIGNKGSAVIKTSSGEEISVKMASGSFPKNVKTGDKIRVYGVPTSTNASKGYSMSANTITITTTLDLDDDYYVPQGKSYRESDTVSASVSSGAVSYRIPSSWTSVKVPEADKAKIFNLQDASEGDCYMLNSLTGKAATECFMIFNVDYETYIYDSDRGKRDGIENAIMFNICPGHFNFVDKTFSSVHTYKAAGHFTNSPTYYRARYQNNYDVEFVFVPHAGSMCVMMYIYDTEAEHLDDVLYVIRSLDPIK